MGAAVPAGPDVPAGSGQLGGAPGGTTPGRRAAAHVDRAQTEIAEYFAGTRREFTVVLDPSGTAFQKRAWSVLRTIPFATILSYADQAKALGSPRLARAVGSANGRNPLPIVVPCHRVVSSDGSLGGYSGGVVVKEWLLAHERRVAGASAGVA